MIDESGGAIDYQEQGVGPTIVLLPGSCSTGAAWRPVIAAWNDRFRTVTTSLLGYGGTAERRTAADPSIGHEAAVAEAVIGRALDRVPGDRVPGDRVPGGRVHLVGHSFGGLVAVAVALRRRVPLASLTIVEASAVELLHDQGEARLYEDFRRMTDAYFAAYEAGNRSAIATMIDFYGGSGTFASWPERVRAYAVETTPVNILDWASAFGFPLTSATLAIVDLPTLVLCGSDSHPAARRANALLARCLNGPFQPIDSAAHFMISTHPAEVARFVGDHVDRCEARAVSAPPRRFHVGRPSRA